MTDDIRRTPDMQVNTETNQYPFDMVMSLKDMVPGTYLWRIQNESDKPGFEAQNIYAPTVEYAPTIWREIVMVARRHGSKVAAVKVLSNDGQEFVMHDLFNDAQKIVMGYIGNSIVYNRVLE